jgi:ribosomal protein S12 methylthiotransferase accessory factor
MFHRPRFNPQFRVEVVPGEGVFLLSELHQTVLEGRLFELVAPCVDGRPVEEICHVLRDVATPAQIFYTLGRLEKRGYLVEADDSLPVAELALWAEYQLDPADAARRLAKTPVTVGAVGAVDTTPLNEMLRSLGACNDGEPALSVVATDSYLRGELRAFNKESLQLGRTWLLVKPVGRWVWLGPLFVPGKTGCLACLTARLEANAPILAYLESKRGNTGEAAAHRAATPATLQAA